MLRLGKKAQLRSWTSTPQLRLPLTTGITMQQLNVTMLWSCPMRTLAGKVVFESLPRPIVKCAVKQALQDMDDETLYWSRNPRARKSWSWRCPCCTSGGRKRSSFCGTKIDNWTTIVSLVRRWGDCQFVAGTLEHESPYVGDCPPRRTTEGYRLCGWWIIWEMLLLTPTRHGVWLLLHGQSRRRPGSLEQLLASEAQNSCEWSTKFWMRVPLS